MNAIDQNIRRIRDYVRENGAIRTAIRAGLARGTLRQCEDANWNPTADTLRKVLALMANENKTSGSQGHAA